jgi:uncharacterized protein with gpF-like domain
MPPCGLISLLLKVETIICHSTSSAMTKTINRKVRNYRKDHQKYVKAIKAASIKKVAVVNKQPISKKQQKKLQQALRRVSDRSLLL